MFELNNVDRDEGSEKMLSKLTLSIPSSESSESLFPSPESSPVGQGIHPYNLDSSKPLVDRIPPGIQPKDVYDASLPWWRAAIRRRLVASVQWESRVIARMQVSYLSYLILRFAGILIDYL